MYFTEKLWQSWKKWINVNKKTTENRICEGKLYKNGGERGFLGEGFLAERKQTNKAK